jgi:cytochrome-b5 reductase
MSRLLHSFEAGSEVQVRGPIPTFSIKPDDFDRIVMISTGTGVAPFLQLLSRISSLSPSGHVPDLHLVHLQPSGDKEDWATTSGLLPRLQEKFGDKLVVHRPPPTRIAPETITAALRGSSEPDRTMILVCLPSQYVFRAQHIRG